MILGYDTYVRTLLVIVLWDFHFVSFLFGHSALHTYWIFTGSVWGPKFLTFHFPFHSLEGIVLLLLYTEGLIWNNITSEDIILHFPQYVKNFRLDFVVFNASLKNNGHLGPISSNKIKIACILSFKALPMLEGNCRTILKNVHGQKHQFPNLRTSSHLMWDIWKLGVAISGHVTAYTDHEVSDSP